MAVVPAALEEAMCSLLNKNELSVRTFCLHMLYYFLQVVLMKSTRSSSLTGYMLLWYALSCCVDQLLAYHNTELRRQCCQYLFVMQATKSLHRLLTAGYVTQAEQRKKTMRRQMSTALMRRPDGTYADEGLDGEAGDEDMEALGRRLAGAQAEVDRLAGQLQQANAKRAELAQVSCTS